MAAIDTILISSSLYNTATYPQVIGGDAAVASDWLYAPEGFTQTGVAKWVYRAGGIPLLYPSITMSVRPPTRQSQISRVMMKVVLPVPDITSPSTATGIQPAPSKAYDITCNMEFLIPNRSTLALRRNALSVVMSMLASRLNASDGDPSSGTKSPLIGAVTDLDTPF